MYLSKSLLTAAYLFAVGDAFSSSSSSSFISTSPILRTRIPSNGGTFKMISTGEDRSEYKNFDISKTTYTSSVKSPKDTYLAFAEKGASNAKMSKTKILHQSILSGCYVGFGALLAFTAAAAFPSPAVARLVFAAVLPFNLFFIVGTGGQLFTGNAAAVAAARFEGLVDNRQLIRSWFTSVMGNLVGCSAFALAAWYSGLLSGPTAAMIANTATAKTSSIFGVTIIKAILCNWMVSLAVFFAGASNSLVGKFVGAWVPGATFVALKLEHLIVNFFVFAAAMLLQVPSMSLGAIIFKNIIPVAIGNTIAGAIMVSMNYSYQFGRLGRKSLEAFKKRLAAYEASKAKLEIAYKNSSSGAATTPAGAFQQKL